MLRGIDLNAHRFSNLFDRHSFEVAQDERRPFVSGQSLHRRGDLFAQLAAEKQTVLLRIGARCAAHLGLLRIAAVVAIESAARAKEIERTVDGDPMQPRSEVRAFLESIELPVCAKERLLNHIVSVMFISCHSIRHAKNGTAVLFDEQPEGVGITGPRPAHGRYIGHLHPTRLRLKIWKVVSPACHPEPPVRLLRASLGVAQGRLRRRRISAPRLNIALAKGILRRLRASE